MRERLAAWRWPLGIVAMLAANAAAQGILYYKATHDPGFAIEKDYYRRALAYDAHAAEERASAALGWSAAVDVDARSIALRLAGRDGRPIDGATVHVEAFANARAADVQRLACASLGAGRYEARVDCARPGEWIVRIEVEKDGQRFLDEVRRDVRAPASAGADAADEGW